MNTLKTTAVRVDLSQKGCQGYHHFMWNHKVTFSSSQCASKAEWIKGLCFCLQCSAFSRSKRVQIKVTEDRQGYPSTAGCVFCALEIAEHLSQVSETFEE